MAPVEGWNALHRHVTYQETHLKCLPAGRTAPARSERRAAHLRTTFMNDTYFS